MGRFWNAIEVDRGMGLGMGWRMMVMFIGI